MKEENRRFPVLLIGLVWLCLAMFCFPAAAQDEDIIFDDAITSIDLGVTSLHLAVGESYTFNVRFEPENTALRTLDWYVTDESVVSIDPLTDTITALANGEARIFAESFDQISYAVCMVTVGDSAAKDAPVMKSGSEFIELSQDDLNKINAETLTRYLDFVAESALDETSYESLSDRLFDVVAAVKPGTEEIQSRRAKDCGVEDSEPLKEMNAVTLIGSLEAILRYAKDNKDLREIFEFGPFIIEDPEMDEVSDESIQKAIGLGENTEKLTKVSYAHKMGLNGKNRWIAVIDSGINRNNPQFQGSGRTIIEACFSTTKKFPSYTLRSVCTNGSKANGSSAARLAWNKARFNHGSHVTGIAAGRDGIAPMANIISIQSHTEKVWTCKKDEVKKYSCGGSHASQCCKTHISNSDVASSYNYVLELSKSRKIDAVNMSYGNDEKWSTVCDKANQFEKKVFDKMLAAGMLPIVSAGNDSYTGFINNAACLSNAYAVGALANKPTPILANYSNHSQKVDITAPGTKIWSAAYDPAKKGQMMYMDGTSMATPMVAGGVALVRQMYPGMTASDVGDFLKDISSQNVTKRSNGKSVTPKPVLSLNRIHFLTVPYYNWVTGGNNSITIKTYKMAYQNVNFTAEITDLNGGKIKDFTVQQKSDANYTYVRIYGTGLKNGQVYNVKLTRSFKFNGVNYWARVTKFGRPTATAASIDTLQSVNGGVTVTAKGSAGVRYFVYDIATGKIVKQVNVTDSRKPYKITGLVNGRLYGISAKPLQTIAIRKNNTTKKVSFYGTESSRKLFIPMTVPFNPKVTYPPVANPTSANVSCTADKGVTGIKIFYRKTGTTKWTEYKGTKPGVFSYSVPGTGRDYDFMIQKYKIQNKVTYTGTPIVLNGRK